MQFGNGALGVGAGIKSNHQIIGVCFLKSKVHAHPKPQKLLLKLLENAGEVLKRKKGFRNAGKVL